MSAEGLVSHESAPHGDGLPWVVLVHYGNPVLTRRCLRDLASTETHAHGVVVVDHGPKPGLGDALAGVHPQLQVVTNYTNPGFGAGCNLGAETALALGARSLWFLNNDAVLEQPVLARLESLASQGPPEALWGLLQREGERLLGADQQPAWFGQGILPQMVPLPGGCRQVGPRESLSGASLFLTRQTWYRLGPWPEDFFLYWEDSAWCRRAHEKGIPLILAGLAITHDRGGTAGHRSPMPTFYGVRNMINLHREILPAARSRRALLAFHVLQKRFFQGRFGLLKPTLHGILAAMRRQRGRDPRY